MHEKGSLMLVRDMNAVYFMWSSDAFLLCDGMPYLIMQPNLLNEICRSYAKLLTDISVALKYSYYFQPHFEDFSVLV